MLFVLFETIFGMLCKTWMARHKLFDAVCLKSSISLRRVLHFLQKRRKIDTERFVRKRSLSEGWTNDIKTFGACCGY